MRIGIDMIGAQAPQARLRGIGRYVRSLVSALVARDPFNDYLLYYHAGLPQDDTPIGANITRRTLSALTRKYQPIPTDSLEDCVDSNRDALDLMLLTSPFEGVCYPTYRLPARPLVGLKMVAIIYDLIPLLFQEQYLTAEDRAERYYQVTTALQQYDALLAISAATQADVETHLDLAPDRVFNIGCAADDRFFIPDGATFSTTVGRGAMRQLGIHQPFVFNVGGTDGRKNLPGLIAAFGLLPERLRQAHQLVITCSLQPQDGQRLRDVALMHGVEDRLVLTNDVPDATLRLLYQQCAVFVFPSFYEGFGLPILEAMMCGAPVIAGHNSSQIEVVGDAGLLVQAADAAALADKVRCILDEPDLARSLRQRSVLQARRFRWDATVERALKVFDQLTAAAPPACAGRSCMTTKPRIAYFSPLPPRHSTIADYSDCLLQELKNEYRIDVYHDSDYVPHLAFASADFGCYDHRLFKRQAALLGYRAVIFHMADCPFHRFIYEALLRYQGIVALHDFGLAGFHHWYARQPGVPTGHFRRELEDSGPYRAREVWRELQRAGAGKCLDEVFARHEVYLNRQIFESALRILVHDPWCLQQAQAIYPEHAAHTTLIPHGARARELSLQQQRAMRVRFDLPEEGLIVGCLGSMYPNKMNVEAIQAFAPLARNHPSATLIFVGHDRGHGEAQDQVSALRLHGQVRFLGHVPTAEYFDLAGTMDIGIHLRRYPVHGTTSGGLLALLGAGVATVVMDTAAQCSYPDDVMYKIEAPEVLAAALQHLVVDQQQRSRIGRAAQNHVRQKLDWSQVARAYAAVIDQCHEEQIYRRPHRPSHGRAPQVLALKEVA